MLRSLQVSPGPSSQAAAAGRPQHEHAHPQLFNPPDAPPKKELLSKGVRELKDILSALSQL